MEASEDSIDGSDEITPPKNEIGARGCPSPSESLRLIKAFMGISDPAERHRIIEDVERIATVCASRRS